MGLLCRLIEADHAVEYVRPDDLTPEGRVFRKRFGRTGT